jgi:hypothetical protein
MDEDQTGTVAPAVPHWVAGEEADQAAQQERALLLHAPPVEEVASVVVEVEARPAAALDLRTLILSL